MEHIRLICPECKQPITLGRRPEESVIRCPHCEGMVVVPLPGEHEEPEKELYGVQAGEPCPSCGHEMPAGAVLCIGCGYHREEGRKLSTKVKLKPIDRTWVYGRGPLGCYGVTRLWRERDGELMFSHRQHILFMSYSYHEFPLEECKEIWLSHEAKFGVLGVVMFIIIMVLCIAWGLLYWWFAYSESRYFLQLPRKKMSPLTIFEGGNEEKMRDILDTLMDVGKLTLMRK